LFPREQILVLQSEALFANPGDQLQRVWRFLGLAPHEMTALPAYKQGHYDAIPQNVHQRLLSYFQPYNERLYSLPGINFRWPSTFVAKDAGLVDSVGEP
jgi:hypothetical protein